MVRLVGLLTLRWRTAALKEPEVTWGTSMGALKEGWVGPAFFLGKGQERVREREKTEKPSCLRMVGIFRKGQSEVLATCPMEEP